MNSFENSMNAAASGMQAQGFRMRVISENIANKDTPGFQRKTVSFDNAYNREREMNLVKVDRVGLDSSALERVYNPAHPMADESGHVELSNVSLMTDGREANRSYEANLATFQQARQMYSSLMDILRR